MKIFNITVDYSFLSLWCGLLLASLVAGCGSGSVESVDDTSGANLPLAPMVYH